MSVAELRALPTARIGSSSSSSSSSSGVASFKFPVPAGAKRQAQQQQAQENGTNNKRTRTTITRARTGDWDPSDNCCTRCRNGRGWYVETTGVPSGAASASTTLTSAQRTHQFRRTSNVPACPALPV